MKTTKRIFAFTMAVMICVSYCMMHISAAGIEFYEYYGNNASHSADAVEIRNGVQG